MNDSRTDQLRSILIEAHRQPLTPSERLVVDDIALAVIRQKSGHDVPDHHASNLLRRFRRDTHELAMAS